MTSYIPERMLPRGYAVPLSGNDSSQKDVAGSLHGRIELVAARNSTHESPLTTHEKPLMFVGMRMSRELITIEPGMMLFAATRLMAKKRIRRLPVLSTSAHDSPLVGILSSTDVLHALPLDQHPFQRASQSRQLAYAAVASELSVREVMTQNPVTITADAPIESAAALMRDRKIGALPVRRGAQPTGLITESDVFRAFTQLFDLSAAGARITFDITDREDVLPFVAAAHAHDLRVTTFVSLHAVERPMCVVHLSGAKIDAMLEDVGTRTIASRASFAARKARVKSSGSTRA
jgi:acetoin utilization protein AcuB